MKFVLSFFFVIVFTILTLTLTKCNYQSTTNTNTKTDSIVTQPQQVNLSLIKSTDFTEQVISTGVLHSARIAQLKFNTSGEVININIKNGIKVKKGTLLAQLQNIKQKLNIERANQAVAASKIELSSLLLGFGGTEHDTNSVNNNLLQSLKIQSGYNTALLNLKQANIEYNNTLLFAPFSGIIANMRSQPNNVISQTDAFCTLIDNSQFFVNFQLLESEIQKVYLGQTITAIPMVDMLVQIHGNVTEINPIINNNGLVIVKALLLNPPISTKLFDGMNMKIILEKKILNQLVVPKQAVVMRTNKNVIFTYKNGLSKWNFVTICGENANSYNICNGIVIGDTIIVGGNLNLVHDAKVSVIPDTNKSK